MSSATGTSVDRYLIDTNVLLRTIEAGSPMHDTARQALQQLASAGATLNVAAQNLIELWVVATRSLTLNGLGLTPAQATMELKNFQTAFQLLPDTPAVFTEWERIATAYNVEGKQAHDARLVAVMKVNGIGKILTFNAGDFARFATGENIAIIDPAIVAAAP